MPVISHWVTWLLIFIGVAFLSLIAGALLLREQVRGRTRELAESRERFRTIFQAAPVSIWVEDLSGVRRRLDELRTSGVSDIGKYIEEHPEFLHELAQEPVVLDVNDATLKLYGAKSKEDLLGALDKVFVPESYEAFRQEIIAIAEGASAFEIEAVNGTLDGRRLDVRISLKIPQEPSAYKNLLVSITDISDLKKANAQLRESEDKFRSFAEKSLVGVYLIQDGIFAYVNPRLAEIFGYSVDELIGKKGPRDLVYPDDWHIVEENLRKRIAGEFNALRYDFRGMTKQKRTLYVEVYGSRMIYRSRPAVIGTLVDITDRKKTEDTLREREERLRMIVENEPECVKILTPDCTLLEMNPAGLAMVEADSLEQVAGKDVCSLVAKKHREAFRTFVRNVLEGKRDSVMFEIIGMKGAHRWLESTGVPLRDTHDLIVGILAVTRDVTERRKLEEQLLHAQKIEAVGQLAGGIAHDFNNILTAIINNAFLLKGRVAGDESAEDLVNKILTLSDNAAAITRELLTFSRKQFFAPAPLAINAVVKNMEKLLTTFIGENIAIRMTLTDEDPVVMSEASRIEQVIINLATNARDAMPHGGSLDIETRVIEMDHRFISAHGFGRTGRYVLLSVSDTGEGMDPATKEKIFDPFFTTKEVGKGTGLGLSVVYGIIQQHQGYVDVYSEQGRGSRFNIYLPLA